MAAVEVVRHVTLLQTNQDAQRAFKLFTGTVSEVWDRSLYLFLDQINHPKAPNPERAQRLMILAEFWNDVRDHIGFAGLFLSEKARCAVFPRYDTTLWGSEEFY